MEEMRWKRFEDERPEEGELIIVVAFNGIKISRYNKERVLTHGKSFYFFNSYSDSKPVADEVYYWMKSPELPEFPEFKEWDEINGYLSKAF